MITYVSPDVPVALLELLRDYVEEVTRHEAYLIYESRWTGPASERRDPFTGDDVDIGRQRDIYMTVQKNKYYKYCNCVHQHSSVKRFRNQPTAV